MLNDFSESLEQSKTSAQQNKQNITNAINFYFDSMKKHENETHYKKWNKRALVAGATSIAGIVGLVAAGTITQNPTFFSPGNLIVGSLLPALAVGVTNYFAAFSPKHRDKLDKIEQARKTTLNEALNSKQVLHDQKEIEVHEAWIEAIGDELYKGVSEQAKNTYFEIVAKRKLEEQQAQSL